MAKSEEWDSRTVVAPGAFGDITEIKNVPLVTYREGGERVEIGSAEVRPDGTVSARVVDPDVARVLAGDGARRRFSFGFGLSAPDRDASLVDALAAQRAENRVLRREVTELRGRLEEQLREAQVMRADVAELARQAGVLLGERSVKP